MRAASISSDEYPRRPSFRCISARECARMPRRRKPAPMALVCGLRAVPDAARLELLIRTSGGPHDTCSLHHRRGRAADSLFPDPGLDLTRKGRVLAQVVADVL